MKQRLLDTVKRLTSSEGIAQNTVHGTIWIAVMNVSDRGLQLVTMIVLARLLNPHAFGLFGVSLLALSATKQFTNIGLDAALVQRKESNVNEYLNTAWVLEAARGVGISAVLFLSAPFIASFFGEPSAVGPLRGIALTPLLLGVRNPGIVYFQKDLDFHKEFIHQISGSVTLALVAIGFAFVYGSVWAIIVGFVAADAVRLAMSYVIHDYRPWFDFDVGKAKELIGFGKWITGSSILGFLHREGDDIVVGWVLSASSLAFYQLAYRFANAPATEISQTVSQVMFPTYSKLQEDANLLRESLFSALQVVSVAAFPLAFGIAAVTPTFVRAFLGPDWLPMVQTMQLLAVYGLIRALGKVWGPVWKAIGRPDYLTKLPLIRVVAMAIFIYPATKALGIEGAALTIVGISIFPMLPLSLYIVKRSVETTYRRFAVELSYPLAASTVMVIAVILVQQNVAFGSAVVKFFVLVGTGAVTYVAAVAVLDEVFEWGVRQNIQAIKGAI